MFGVDRPRRPAADQQSAVNAAGIRRRSRPGGRRAGRALPGGPARPGGVRRAADRCAAGPHPRRPDGLLDDLPRARLGPAAAAAVRGGRRRRPGFRRSGCPGPAGARRRRGRVGGQQPRARHGGGPWPLLWLWWIIVPAVIFRSAAALGPAARAMTPRGPGGRGSAARPSGHASGRLAAPARAAARGHHGRAGQLITSRHRMIVNLYSTIPAGTRTARRAAIGRALADARADRHAILGCCSWWPRRPGRAGRRLPPWPVIVASSLGLLAVLAAASSGSRFVSTGATARPLHGRGHGRGHALYAVSLYILAAAGQRTSAPSASVMAGRTSATFPRRRSAHGVTHSRATFPRKRRW